MAPAMPTSLPAVGIAVVASLLACTNGSAPQKDTAPEVLAAAGGKAPTKAPAVAPAAPVPMGPQLTSFPAVDTSRLDAAGKAFFQKVANEEICPCDCPKSFGQCLQQDTQCMPAVIFADWIITQLADGMPGEMLQEAITRELTSGFSGAVKVQDIAGFTAKGSNAPKYTIVEYADFECAHCKAAGPQMDALVKKHPEVKVVFKHFPLSFHAMARSAAIAVEAAGRQKKFWEMHDAVFATQEMLSDELILGHAKALGLDVNKFKTDLADPELAKRVDASRAEGEALGINATPAFFVNGRPYFLARNVEGFELRFAMEAARATSSCN
jgi:protein-disulfide isomerase